MFVDYCYPYFNAKCLNAILNILTFVDICVSECQQTHATSSMIRKLQHPGCTSLKGNNDVSV